MYTIIAVSIVIIYSTYYFFRRIFMNKIVYKNISPADEEPVSGRIVLITGANSGIGKATAEEMAKRGAHVILACRRTYAANQTIKSIRNKTSSGTLTPLKLDLASLQSVREFCEEVKKKYEKIDILINNAGLFLPVVNNVRKRTADGLEMTFGVNHLGHFYLTNLLLDLVKKSKNGRIINVSSMGSRHGVMNFDDIMLEKANLKTTNPFSPKMLQMYANSKLANVLFTHELAKRLKGTGINSYALCPGYVDTNIFQPMKSASIMFYNLLMSITLLLLSKTPTQGCQTTLYCALSKKCANESGKMYTNCQLWDDNKTYFPEDLFVPEKFGRKINDHDSKKLWEISEQIVGLANK